LDRDSSIVAPPEQVRADENDDILRYSTSGYDDDDDDDGGGSATEGLLTEIYRRFGPVSSYTGTYQADVWELNIDRRNPDNGETVIHGRFGFALKAGLT
jgi:hypothetical protein